MDQNPDEILDAKSARLAMQNIPPPDLPKPNIAPPAPLDPPPAATPPTPTAGAGAGGVKVNIRTGGDPDEDAEPSAGAMAPFNTRVSAAVIDAVVAWGVSLGLIWLLPGFAEKLAWIVACGYMVTRDSLPFLSGQSVGKKAMNLRAVTLDGKPLTGNWEPSLIRGGVLLIPFFQLVEFWILLTREETPRRGVRLGDEWAKTKVIIEPKPEPAGEE